MGLDWVKRRSSQPGRRSLQRTQSLSICLSSTWQGSVGRCIRGWRRWRGGSRRRYRRLVDGWNVVHLCCCRTRGKQQRWAEFDGVLVAGWRAGDALVIGRFLYHFGLVRPDLNHVDVWLPAGDLEKKKSNYQKYIQLKVYARTLWEEKAIPTINRQFVKDVVQFYIHLISYAWLPYGALKKYSRTKIIDLGKPPSNLILDETF